MPDGIRWVGLDVHARESTLAILDQGSGEVTTKRVVGRPHEVLPWLRALERPARMVYEAGPTGYGLARRARAEGLELGIWGRPPNATNPAAAATSSAATTEPLAVAGGGVAGDQDCDSLRQVQAGGQQRNPRELRHEDRDGRAATPRDRAGHHDHHDGAFPIADHSWLAERSSG
jgi:hypothetical protein